MIKLFLFTLSCTIVQFTHGQSFAPPAGQVGSTAIHKDSSIIINWATSCTVTRGFMDLSDTILGYADYGTDTNAIGYATGSDVVSLGDGGEALLSFDRPITNVPGPDFVVFENSFSETFLELAFVEVSSDGVNFFRFPAVSETQTAIQIGGFGSLDARYLYNFAGKYIANYGTPFELDGVSGFVNLDVNAITHVKIIDVVGSVNSQYGTTDSQGNYVNDPFPTPFSSSGFDLDAVGVLHELPLTINEMAINDYIVFPNPTNSIVNISTQNYGSYTLKDTQGRIVSQSQFSGSFKINLTDEKKGVYFLTFIAEGALVVQRIIKT